MKDPYSQLIGNGSSSESRILKCAGSGTLSWRGPTNRTRAGATSPEEELKPAQDNSELRILIFIWCRSGSDIYLMRIRIPNMMRIRMHNTGNRSVISDKLDHWAIGIDLIGIMTIHWFAIKHPYTQTITLKFRIPYPKMRWHEGVELAQVQRLQRRSWSGRRTTLSCCAQSCSLSRNRSWPSRASSGRQTHSYRSTKSDRSAISLCSFRAIYWYSICGITFISLSSVSGFFSKFRSRILGPGHHRTNNFFVGILNKSRGSGSAIQWYGLAVPDPYQNVKYTIEILCLGTNLLQSCKMPAMSERLMHTYWKPYIL